MWWKEIDKNKTIYIQDNRVAGEIQTRTLKVMHTLILRAL